MIEQSTDELLRRIETIAQEKKELIEAVKIAYGALTGVSFSRYDGRGGPRAAFNHAIEACKKAMRKNGVNHRAIAAEVFHERGASYKDRVIGLNEAAELLGMHPATLWKKIQDEKGHPPYFRYGSHYKFRLSALLKWVKSQEISARIRGPRGPYKKRQKK